MNAPAYATLATGRFFSVVIHDVAPAWLMSRLQSDCLAFSTRSAWRRALSLPRNRWVASHWHRDTLVRLELHPHDADYPQIRRCWMRELETLLRQRQALTLADAMQRLQSSGAPPCRT